MHLELSTIDHQSDLTPHGRRHAPSSRSRDRIKSSLIIIMDPEASPPLASAHSLQWSSGLHRAAAEGDTENLLRLLQDGHSPNQRGAIGWWIRGAYQPNRTPLHLASKEGHLKCIRLLLSYGADPNAQDDDDYTPLHYLCQIHSPGRERSEELRLGTTSLLEFGADPGLRAKAGHTPLALAMRQNNSVCRSILEEHSEFLKSGSSRQVPNITCEFLSYSCKLFYMVIPHLVFSNMLLKINPIPEKSHTQKLSSPVLQVYWSSHC